MNELFTLLLNEAPLIQDKLHFIRPEWFYSFIPLILYLWLSVKFTSNDSNWHSVIDSQLLPFVLDKTNTKKRRYPLLLIFIAASLCITSLAGPVYKKLPQPVYREQSSLVVLFDLSQSMNAGDIKPSRLSRAKLKLLDLLETRKTGQTALIVYAADAFVVTPLTDDNSTIANLVPSLATDMMPAQGSNLSVALAKTISLFSQSGIINGDILVMTDDIRQRDEDAIQKISSQGHRLSIYGIGTSDGAPIPLDETLGGGFLQDSHGAIVIPKLQSGKLKSYALKGSGLYASLQADDSDINKLSNLFQSSKIQTESATDNSQDLNADIWQEEGHWLLLPLLLLAALWSRKGWLAALLPFTIIFILPATQPVHAAPFNIDSKHLWSSPDQKAMQAFNAGDNESAARNFTKDEWKASAHYRNKDYDAVVETLKDAKSSDALYNKANALAQLGKLEEAIEAYDQALEIDESDADTLYNREQVKNALQEQNEQQDKGDSEDDAENKPEDSDEQNEDSQEKSDQESEQKSDQESEQKSEQQSDQKSENSESDNKEKSQDSKQQPEQDKQAEKELKQRDAEAETEQQKKDKQEYEKSLEDKDKEKQDEDKPQDNENIENIKPEDSNSEEPNSEDKPAEIEVNPVEASITEQEKATEQWLKRIPDDPGGLLRRKFQYQYKHIPNQNDDKEPW